MLELEWRTKSPGTTPTPWIMFKRSYRKVCEQASNRELSRQAEYMQSLRTEKRASESVGESSWTSTQEPEPWDPSS